MEQILSDMAILSKTISANIRKLRENKNWNQLDLASKAGIGSSNLAKIESEKSVPKLLTLAKLAKSLDVPIDRLLMSDDSFECRLVRQIDIEIKEIDELLVYDEYELRERGETERDLLINEKEGLINTQRIIKSLNESN